MLNYRKDRLMKGAFNVFDFNEDGGVSQPDMFAIMKMYENDDEVFVKAYSHDICKIVEALHQKAKMNGKEDFDIKIRMKNIEKKLKKLTKKYTKNGNVRES